MASCESDGSLLVCDTSNHKIRKITFEGMCSLYLLNSSLIYFVKVKKSLWRLSLSNPIQRPTLHWNVIWNIHVPFIWTIEPTFVISRHIQAFSNFTICTKERKNKSFCVLITLVYCWTKMGMYTIFFWINIYFISYYYYHRKYGSEGKATYYGASIHSMGYNIFFFWFENYFEVWNL